jgi:hypothetical protein
MISQTKIVSELSYVSKYQIRELSFNQKEQESVSGLINIWLFLHDLIIFYTPSLREIKNIKIEKSSKLFLIYH